MITSLAKFTMTTMLRMRRRIFVWLYSLYWLSSSSLADIIAVIIFIINASEYIWICFLRELSNKMWKFFFSGNIFFSSRVYRCLVEQWNVAHKHLKRLHPKSKHNENRFILLHLCHICIQFGALRHSVTVMSHISHICGAIQSGLTLILNAFCCCLRGGVDITKRIAYSLISHVII